MGLEGGPFVPTSADYGDEDANHAAALWLPYRGLEGGLLSRYLRIMVRHMAALWLHYGAGGRPFVPVSADFGDER